MGSSRKGPRTEPPSVEQPVETQGATGEGQSSPLTSEPSSTNVKGDAPDPLAEIKSSKGPVKEVSFVYLVPLSKPTCLLTVRANAASIAGQTEQLVWLLAAETGCLYQVGQGDNISG
jgi:hypothetical protein